jgi:hypothetical protein
MVSAEQVQASVKGLGCEFGVFEATYARRI